MALSFDWKKNLPKIIWGVILLVLALCLLKVAIWEGNYYAEKEGSQRAKASVSTISPDDTSEEIDETERTEADKQAYKVSPSKPRFLSIDKLGIDRARIVEVGANNYGRLLTPGNVFDVGWYRLSSKPGEGGTILIDGHNGGPNVEGVFKHLPDLVPGDIITIERGDGKFFRYEVYDNTEVPLADSDEYMKNALISPVDKTESLSLITCTGVWSQVQQTYLSRQFLRAILVTENTNYEATQIKNELQEKRDAEAKKAEENEESS